MDHKEINYIIINTVLFGCSAVSCGSQDGVLPSVTEEVFRALVKTLKNLRKELTSEKV